MGGALGGAIASSVLAPLVSQRGERRALRADVLHRLGELERLRWFHTDDQFDEFRRALMALRTAGLIAAADRELIEYYCHLAWTARLTSEHAVEVGDDVGGIPSELADLVRDAAKAVSDDIWHPVTSDWAGTAALKSCARVSRAFATGQGMPTSSGRRSTHDRAESRRESRRSEPPATTGFVHNRADCRKPAGCAAFRTSQHGSNSSPSDASRTLRGISVGDVLATAPVPDR